MSPRKPSEERKTCNIATLRGIRPLSTLLLVLLAVCSSGSRSRAGAQERAPIRVKASEMEPMTFARIVLRVKSTGEIAFSGEELRVAILEALRRQGYPALGAESLVFDRDKADQAQIVLGATVTELDCMIPAFGVRQGDDVDRGLRAAPHVQ